ncbi:unknown similar to AMEV040 [Mythimna separata entomopoxvirus 'L']|uniref:Uncharacterized protein n=1 Tax=Mythimna separata entomopoxvirus 'L' TaxID=1293572 RepID=A0A916KQ99_9POXV|nr:unknown similar to AMEV040 [Mythimna separata entomopoxvirus 'L']CCU56265.1 unknown similar to AMEV040 [Mythimna separata entomopoxvirus 'L']
MKSSSIDIIIDNDILDKIIDYCYKYKIPNNNILKLILIKYFYTKNKNIDDVLYKVYDLKYDNNNEKKKFKNNTIYEYITHFDDYSPILNYYDRNNIKYEKYTGDIDLSNIEYIKLLEYDEFKYISHNKINNMDTSINDFINGLCTNNKKYKKLLYFIVHSKVPEPDFIIDIVKIPQKINVILS